MKPAYRFSGPVFDPVRDGARLTKQHDVIRALMLDGVWRSLPEIALETGYPEASISAQLRHLKKPAYGSYLLDKRRRDGNLWEYHVAPPGEAQGVMDFARGGV